MKLLEELLPKELRQKVDLTIASVDGFQGNEPLGPSGSRAGLI